MKQENQKIIDKYKREHSLKGAIADQLLKSIADSIELIESSQDKMKLDTSDKVPYGFTKNRFGELRVHPGATIIRESDNNIRACLKQLGIKIEIKKVKEISLMEQAMGTGQY